MVDSFDDLNTFLLEYYRGVYSDFRSDDEIPAELPEVHRDFYARFGVLVNADATKENDFRRPFATQDYLCRCDELEVIEDFVEFAYENQGNWSCRYGLGDSNPVVLSNAAELIGEGEGFEDIGVSLSDCLITFVLQETVMSSRCLCSLDSENIDDWLSRGAEPIWLNGKTAFNEVLHSFYYIPREQVLFMDYSGFWAASNSVDVETLLTGRVPYSRIY